MAWSWFSRRAPQWRRGLLRIRPNKAAAKRRRRSAPLGVRRLERRRVLDAAITSFTPMGMDGTVTVPEGEVTATATATGQGTLFFTWTLTKDGDLFASSQQSATSNQQVNFTFFLPDDNNEGQELPNYELRLRVVDSFQTIDSVGPTTLAVQNVAPLIENLIADDVMEGHTTTLIGNYHDPGTDDTHFLDIDWDGDGTFDELGVPVSGGVFSIPHVYPDDDPETGTPQDTFNIKVRITDDDGDSSMEPVSVTVFNDPPEFVGINANATDEGGEVEVVATIVDDGALDVWSVDVDWRDGAHDTIDGLGSVNTNGTVGLTDYSWNAATHRLVLSHHYLDDDPSETPVDPYEILLRVTDDDTGQNQYSVETFVQNVPPALTVAADMEINEGQSVDLSGLGGAMYLGSFTDVGTLDTHVATVDWDDGTIEDGLIIESDGSGTISGQHFYADNDEDNLYTVTVTLFDDDGSSDERSFDIMVYNVNPTLNPITATDVEPSGRTTLNLTFSDPGADTFRVLVNWGDKLDMPSEEQFVEAATFDGPTPTSMTLEYFYSGPPDPLHPTADITITVMIFDDDQLIEGVMDVGISEPMFATISNPGIAEHMAAIDTTPDVQRLAFAPPAEAEVFLAQQVATAQSLQSARISVGGGELAATAQRYLQLCMIRPDGRPEKCFRIKDEALFDLRGLFASLPDGRYHVLLVRTENNTRRMVIEVDVRRGKLVNTWDDSEGTRDRPPTSESGAGGPIGNAVPLEQNPLLEPLPDQGQPDQTTTDDDVTCNCDGEQLAPAPKPAEITGSPEPAPKSTPLAELELAGLGLVVAGSWSRRVDAAFEQAGRRDWQRLRRAGRTGRFLHRAG